MDAPSVSTDNSGFFLDSSPGRVGNPALRGWVWSKTGLFASPGGHWAWPTIARKKGTDSFTEIGRKIILSPVIRFSVIRFSNRNI